MSQARLKLLIVSAVLAAAVAAHARSAVASFTTPTTTSEDRQEVCFNGTTFDLEFSIELPANGAEQINRYVSKRVFGEEYGSLTQAYNDFLKQLDGWQKLQDVDTPAFLHGQQGRVVCTFVVEADGSISNIRVAKSVNRLLDAEAVRVISTMPRWQPGKKDGKNVRVRYTIPVTFWLRR